MSIKALNSVAGFSVGETPVEIILSNGDITTGNANLVGNLFSNAVLTDNYLYANGAPVDFNHAAGPEFSIQYKEGLDLAGDANFSYNPQTSTVVVGNLNATSNVNVLGEIVANGNVTASYFLGNVVGNISGNLTVPGVDKSLIYNRFGSANGSSALTFDPGSNTLSVVGNIDATNINALSIGAIDIIGTLATAYQPNITTLGNLTNLKVDGNITLGKDLIISGNIVSGNQTTGSITSDSITTGNINSNANIVANNITSNNSISGSTLTITGNISGGNIASLGNLSAVGDISGANLSVTNVIANGNVVATGDVITTGNISGNNLSINDVAATGDIFANNVTANSNVTVGANLSAEGITANVGIETANLKITGNIWGNLIPIANSVYNIGSEEKRWNDVWISGEALNIGNVLVTEANTTLTINGNAAITDTLDVDKLRITGNIDALGNINLSGNLRVSGSTEYIDVTNLSVKNPLILLGGEDQGGNATLYDGKDRGLLLQNYKNDGSGILNQFFGWSTANAEFVAVNDVASFDNDIVVANSLGNIRADNFFGNINGTLISSSQPNITTLGNLTGLQVNGNANVTGTLQANVLQASGILYPTLDGQPGQVLMTNGAGTIGFGTPVTDTLSKGTSNLSVRNDYVTVSANGVANVVTITNNGVDMLGNVTVTGDVTSNNVSANTNISLGITNISWASYTSNDVSPSQVIVSVPSNGIRGVEFFVKGEEVSGTKYSVETLSAVHNGTAVDFSKYGAVTLGGYMGRLAVLFDNGSINLVVSPASSNSIVWTTQYRTI